MSNKLKNIITCTGFFIVLSFLLIVYFQNNGPSITGEVIYEGITEKKTIESNKLHFSHTPIIYNFGDIEINNSLKCPDYQKDRVRDAFDILEKEIGGVVTFQENGSVGDITIFCYGSQARGMLLMDMGNAEYSIERNTIKDATIRFYTHRNCGTWPDVELHEILHLFGFEHKEDKWSIMNPIAARCDLGKINEEIITELMEIYG